MIIFKYSFYWDVIWFLRNFKNRKWLKEHNIVYIPLTLHQLFLNIFHKRIIKTEEFNLDMGKSLGNITCYWISSGTWGAYTPPNKIFICPKNIHKTGGLKRVIEHEITHLAYAHETDNLEHEKKEDFINSHANKIGKQ